MKEEKKKGREKRNAENFKREEERGKGKMNKGKKSEKERKSEKSDKKRIKKNVDKMMEWQIDTRKKSLNGDYIIVVLAWHMVSVMEQHVQIPLNNKDLRD